MPLQMFKESFKGSYDGITPATLLPVGSISDGLNVRKVAIGGGWKPRKGCTVHNTTSVHGSAPTAVVLSLHQYIHPRNDDYHFMAQIGYPADNCYLYDATNDPPAAGGTTFGTSLVSGLSTSLPGFSTMVDEHFFYADGSGPPTVYGGTFPYCSGFIAHFDIANDGTPDTYADFTREVTDDRGDDTYAMLRADEHDVYYVCSPEKASAIRITIPAAYDNDIANVLTVSSWQAGAWDVRTGDAAWADGTIAPAGTTHGQTGTVVWNVQSADTMRVIGGIMGYWYRFAFSAAMTAGVRITKCQVVFAAQDMTNKWSGVYEYPAAVRFYDHSETEYVDHTGKVTNESTSQYMQVGDMQTDDFIYIKTIEPATGFGFGVVGEYTQTINAQIDQIDVWTGIAFTAATTGIIDETLDVAKDSSFAQTGVVWFNAAAVTAKRRSFDWDSVPGYWYRISIDAAFTDDDIRIFVISTVPFPAPLPNVKGVIEFKNRLFLWGGPEYPNRFRYSANGKPDCFCGSDSGYTDAFGDMKEITCAKRFQNELMTWKEESVWLLEGYSPQTFGKLLIADTIGLASPQTARVIETGYPGMKTDEPLSIAIWEAIDGVYALDGRKPKKVSMPVDHFFNTEYSTAIAAASIANRQSFVDPLNNEYHLLLPTSELVYNYVKAEWYPPWERNVDLVCGLSLKGTDGRFYTYGGDAAGTVYRLESDTTDKAENAESPYYTDVAISHYIKTRAIAAKQEASTSLRFSFRKLWVEAKARAVATAITVTFYKNMATAGTDLDVPAAIDLLVADHTLSFDGLDTSQENCVCFELKFALNTADLEMELWSFLYEVDARGEIGF